MHDREQLEQVITGTARIYAPPCSVPEGITVLQAAIRMRELLAVAAARVRARLSDGPSCVVPKNGGGVTVDLACATQREATIAAAHAHARSGE